MTAFGMTLLLLGGIVYTIIPVLKFKLISIVLMIIGYLVVKCSEQILIALGGIYDRRKLRKPQ